MLGKLAVVSHRRTGERGYKPPQSDDTCGRQCRARGWPHGLVQAGPPGLTGEELVETMRGEVNLPMMSPIREEGYGVARFVYYARVSEDDPTPDHAATAFA